MLVGTVPFSWLVSVLLIPNFKTHIAYERDLIFQSTSVKVRPAKTRRPAGPRLHVEREMQLTQNSGDHARNLLVRFAAKLIFANLCDMTSRNWCVRLRQKNKSSDDRAPGHGL